MKAKTKKIAVPSAIVVFAVSVIGNLFSMGGGYLENYRNAAFNAGANAVNNALVQQLQNQGQIRLNLNGQIIVLKPEGTVPKPQSLLPAISQSFLDPNA